MAVSGGVDSVVLLDMLVAGQFFGAKKSQLVVAHVDHGIRADSGDDARLVAALAEGYGLQAISTELTLGKNASEEQARSARYEFLFYEAKKHQASIVTAHHRDDLVETIALNLERGTGWRGLCVLSRSGIERPLVGMTKSDIYQYALENHLEWVEDSTNRSLVYQRNRLRYRLHNLPVSTVEKLVQLRENQIKLRAQINAELVAIATEHRGSRHFLTQIDSTLAEELLATMIEQTGGERPVRPQLKKAIHAIKTAHGGTTHHIGSGVKLVFSARHFEITLV